MYRLPERGNIDTLLGNVDTSTVNVDTLLGNVDTLTDKQQNNSDDNEFTPEAKELLKKKRLRKSEMTRLLSEIASEWRTTQELTQILGKDKSYLKNHVLPMLISNGVLEREYPSIINHPSQRYRVRKQK